MDQIKDKENNRAAGNITRRRRNKLSGNTPTKNVIQKSPKRFTPKVKRSKRLRGRPRQVKQEPKQKKKKTSQLKKENEEAELELQKKKEKKEREEREAREKRIGELSEENEKLKAQIKNLQVENQSNSLDVANLDPEVVRFHKALCSDLVEHRSSMEQLSWTWKELAKQMISSRDNIDMEEMENCLNAAPSNDGIEGVLKTLSMVETSDRPECVAWKESVKTLFGRFSEANQILRQFPLKDSELADAVATDFVRPLDEVIQAPYMQLIRQASEKYTQCKEQAELLKKQLNEMNAVDDPRNVRRQKELYFEALEAVVEHSLKMLDTFHQKEKFNTEMAGTKLSLQRGADIVAGLIGGYTSLQEKCRVQLKEIADAQASMTAGHQQRMNEYTYKKNEYCDFLAEDQSERQEIAEQLGKLFEREVDRRHRFMDRQKNDKLQDLQKDARVQRLQHWEADANTCQTAVQKTKDLNRHGQLLCEHVQESLHYGNQQLKTILQQDTNNLTNHKNTFEKELVEYVNKLYTDISLEEWRTWESIRSYQQDIKHCNINVKKFTMLGQSRKIEAARNESQKVAEILRKEQKTCDDFRVRREKIVTADIKRIFEGVRAREPALGVDMPKQAAAKAVYHEKLVLAELTSESSHIGHHSLMGPIEVQARLETDMEPLEAMFGYGTTPIKAVRRCPDYGARKDKSRMLIERYHNKLEMFACVGCLGEYDQSCFDPAQLRLSLLKRRCRKCNKEQQQKKQLPPVPVIAKKEVPANQDPLPAVTETEPEPEPVVEVELQTPVKTQQQPVDIEQPPAHDADTDMDMQQTPAKTEQQPQPPAEDADAGAGAGADADADADTDMQQSQPTQMDIQQQQQQQQQPPAVEVEQQKLAVEIPPPLPSDIQPQPQPQQQQPAVVDVEQQEAVVEIPPPLPEDIQQQQQQPPAAAAAVVEVEQEEEEVVEIPPPLPSDIQQEEEEEEGGAEEGETCVVEIEPQTKELAGARDEMLGEIQKQAGCI